MKVMEVTKKVIRAACGNPELVQEIMSNQSEGHDTVQEGDGAIHEDRDIAREIIVTDMGGP